MMSRRDEIEGRREEVMMDEGGIGSSLALEKTKLPGFGASKGIETSGWDWVGGGAGSQSPSHPFPAPFAPGTTPYPSVTRRCKSQTCGGQGGQRKWAGGEQGVADVPRNPWRTCLEVPPAVALASQLPARWLERKARGTEKNTKTLESIGVLGVSPKLLSGHSTGTLAKYQYFTSTSQKAASWNRKEAQPQLLRTGVDHAPTRHSTFDTRHDNPPKTAATVAHYTPTNFPRAMVNFFRCFSWEILGWPSVGAS